MTGPMIGRQGGPGGNVDGRDLGCRRTNTRITHSMPARRAVRSVGESVQDMQVSCVSDQNGKESAVKSEMDVGEVISLSRLI